MHSCVIPAEGRNPAQDSLTLLLVSRRLLFLDTGFRRYDDEGSEGMRNAEAHAAEHENDISLAARVLELWRLCGRTSCRRARDCRGDARKCCESVAEWSAILALKNKKLSFQQCLQALRVKQSSS